MATARGRLASWVMLSVLTISHATAIEKPAVARLLQLYLHDFSELAKIGEPHGEIGDDGTFAYKHFDSYWTDARREPLLFRFGERIAGFAFINDWSASGESTNYSVAEFFVLRKYRRAGLGTEAIRQILKERRAVWEIPVAHYNSPALAFWRQVTSALPDYNVTKIDATGARWFGPIYRLSPAPAG
jgi:predicted acetyltransferase